MRGENWEALKCKGLQGGHLPQVWHWGRGRRRFGLCSWMIEEWSRACGCLDFAQLGSPI
jgi:hypothetical protein